MAAILWDGFNKINGFLRIEQSSLSFSFVDFNDTNLHLQIPFSEIESISYYRLFSQEINGVEIISKAGKSNVFVVEEAEKLYSFIQLKLTNSKQY